MKQGDERGKENERATSGRGKVIRFSNSQKKSSLKEADGIIHGDAKKAGEAVIEDHKKARS